MMTIVFTKSMRRFFPLRLLNQFNVGKISLDPSNETRNYPNAIKSTGTRTNCSIGSRVRGSFDVHSLRRTFLTDSKSSEAVSKTNEMAQIDFYARVVQSIPEEDRSNILSELDGRTVIQRAERLKQQLSDANSIGLDLNESRVLFLAALRLLKHKKISIHEFATLHVLDSAIRTLYTELMMCSFYRYVDSHGEECLTANAFEPTSKRGYPLNVKRVHFTFNQLPHSANEKLRQSQSKQYLPLRRFFNLDGKEWRRFSKIMTAAPLYEQHYHMLIVPEAGCWSILMHFIQSLLDCMQEEYIPTHTKDGNIVNEKTMIVPSFSMFQAALDAKAATLQRKPVTLVPTYGYLPPESYAALKAKGEMPVTMYLPERDERIRYNNNRGGFRTTVDGHRYEAAFAVFVHDIYHTMRLLVMSPEVAEAVMRLAKIAQAHPMNKKTPDSPAVHDILIDGELIYSYPPKLDTMFKPSMRPRDEQIFGHLFYIYRLKNNLHPDLKHAFIDDMVNNAELWQRKYRITREDLLECEREIYDEIQSKHCPRICQSMSR